MSAVHEEPGSAAEGTFVPDRGTEMDRERRTKLSIQLLN